MLGSLTAPTGSYVRIWDWHKRTCFCFVSGSVGIEASYQVTNAVFLGSPPPLGYGFSQYAIAGAYGTPMVCAAVKHEGI